MRKEQGLRLNRSSLSYRWAEHESSWIWKVVLYHPEPQAMRAAGSEPFPAIMVDSKEEGKVGVWYV